MPQNRFTIECHKIGTRFDLFYTQSQAEIGNSRLVRTQKSYKSDAHQSLENTRLEQELGSCWYSVHFTMSFFNIRNI